jgi:transcriptional regulator with XRE-family HTH domain
VGSLHEASYRLLLKRIRRVRRAADITQAELAEKLGTDQSFVSKYERGERRLDVVELRTICQALGIDFVDFLSDFEKELQEKELA